MHLGSGPLNFLRLARFVEHNLFPVSRGTRWSGRPLLWSYATFCAQQPVFEALGRASCLPNSRFASVLVHFWHEACFPCLGGGTRVGDHLFSLETTFLSPADFLVRKLVSLVFEPHLLVSHHTTSLHSMWRPSNGAADHLFLG